MADDWPSVPLEEVADLSGGYAFKSEEYAPSGRFVLRTLNIGDDGRIHRDQAVYIPLTACAPYRRFELQANDILFVMVGATLGKVGVVTAPDLPALLNQNMWRVRAVRGAIDERFLFYAFKSCAASGLAGASGSARLFVRRDDYRRLAIPLPPIEHQRTIASILGALDDKIDLNRRMNETLEAMAQAIFKDWFVDFGPTRAKMEGRAPYLTPEIWALFPDGVDDEGKPEGWSTSPLLDLAHLISGGTPKTEEPAYWGGGIAWASAKDVSQCKEVFLITSERTITERGVAESSTRIVPRFATVVVARGATTGRFCMFGRDMAMNQTCYALTAKRDRAFWLNCAFWSLVEKLVHAAHGSVFNTITTTTIEGARVTVPNAALLDHFEAHVGPFFRIALSNIEECETLAATRDLLLPKLMSGEIRVKDAEKIAEAIQ